MLAFASARRALTCSRAIERSISETFKDPGSPVRVRIGLHVGETTREADDFFGHAVNYAARIASSATGGEIVVSSLVYGLLAQTGEFEFEPAREVELKGVEGLQMVIPPLRRDERPGGIRRSDRRRDGLLGRRACRPGRRGRVRQGIRSRASGLGDPERGRYAVRDRERHQGPDRPDRDEPGRGRTAEPDDHRTLGAGRRSAADRRRRDRRTPARAPIRHRRLLRRGDRARTPRLRVARPRPGARIHRGLPPSARGVRDQVPARRTLLVQQRRLRGARADRRARLRDIVLRAPAATRVRTRRHGGHGVPALDELPGRTALGYLVQNGPRTNLFHVPVRGSGDGGIFTTAADVSALWTAVFAGRIVSMDVVAEMVQPRSEVPSPTQPARFGLGIWLHPTRDLVELHGSDAGCRSRPSTIRASSSPTRSCRTRPMARGPSSCISTSSSRGEP